MKTANRLKRSTGVFKLCFWAKGLCLKDIAVAGQFFTTVIA